MEFEACEFPNSRNYVLEFLDNLNDRRDPTKTTAQKILDKLVHYENLSLGQLMRAEHIKVIDGDLYEVRVPVRGDQFRFFGYVNKNIFYMVHAIKKKQQKTPKKAIALSQERINIIKNEN
jgi:phage-related protein